MGMSVVVLVSDYCVEQVCCQRRGIRSTGRPMLSTARVFSLTTFYLEELFQSSLQMVVLLPLFLKSGEGPGDSHSKDINYVTMKDYAPRAVELSIGLKKNL